MIIHSETAMTDKSFMRKITTSVFVILFAAFCMVTSAWAMFSDTVTGVDQQLVGANFYVKTDVTLADGTKYNIPANGVFDVGNYTVTVTACGTVSERSGYFKVIFGNPSSLDSVKYYSPQMRTENQLKKGKLEGYPTNVMFNLKITQPTKVTFAASWATYVNDPAFCYISTDAAHPTTIEYPLP